VPCPNVCAAQKRQFEIILEIFPDLIVIANKDFLNYWVK
jgi:hypothetical protein